MRSFHAAAAAAVLACSHLTGAWSPDLTTGTDVLVANGLINLTAYKLLHPSTSKNCNLQTGYIRKEWHTLRASERTAYINAVLCLQQKPSRSGDAAPGAKSRYDDFVAVHIQQTLTIHGTGNFLSWHRYFTWAYENALRTECGYTGYQPYLNWGKIASDPLGAPLFDGSATSMSGNGEYEEHNSVSIPSAAAPLIVLPPQQGGGCINTGPFRNMSVNLGPLSPALDDVPANPSPDGLGYNPRCLRRDISPYVTNMALKDSNTAALIKQNNDILSFQNTMQGDFAAGQIGVHTAGHYIVGGDPGGDIFASPGDPFFFLHHAQIDRVWWIWQNQDLKNRQNAIAGTITLLNQPPSRNATLADIIDLGAVGVPQIAIKDAMSTLDGPFCYVYV